jgi:predicted transcriptional regulator
MRKTTIAGTKVGELEERILAVLLAKDQAMTGREVHDNLGPPARAYTTVMTVLNRLVDKGLVERVNEDGIHRYEVAGGVDRLTAKEIDKLLARADDPRQVLAYFVEEIHDEALLAELAAMIERQQQ